MRTKLLAGILLFLLVAAASTFAVPHSLASSGSGSSGSDDNDPSDRSDPDDESDLGYLDDDDRSYRDDGSGEEALSGDDADDSHDNLGPGSGEDDNSGPGSDNSGPGSGEDVYDDNSGPGSGSGATGGDNSGPSENSGKGETGKVGRAEERFEITNGEGGEVRHGEVVHVSSHADISARVAARGLKIIETFLLPSLGMKGLRIAVPNKRTGQSVLDELRSVDPRGISTFNHVYSPARGGVIPGTPAHKPPVKRMDARIGLVDAGVDNKHPMLRDVKILARAFGLGSSAPENHGTAVASRIAEAAPGAHIVVANVFTTIGNGREIASADAIVRGLDWLAQMQVPVINLSLSGPANALLEAMAARLSTKGHILVAAVGNEGPHAAPQYPAAYENVVGVTAVDTQDQVYLYANQGDYVDFAAYGVNTDVAKSSGDVEKVSGTSYAAPVVAVALARLISRPDSKLAQSAHQTLARSARDLGKPGRDPIFGFGLIGLER